MLADDVTRAEIEGLVRDTYRRMSTPGADPGELFTHPDMAAAGSGEGELMYGPEQVGEVSRAIAGWGFAWKPEEVRAWQEDSVAWAQVLGHVLTRRDGIEESVPYWTTGVFVHDGTSWQWCYWGGSEPQATPGYSQAFPHADRGLR